MSGVTIAILAGSTAAAFVLGLILQRFLAARVRKGAMSEAERILADARRESETLKKEAVLEGREVIAGERAAELEMQQKRRSEIDRKESDLSRRSEFVDRTREKLERRESVMETRENGLAEREQALAAKQQRVTKLMEEQNQLLEQIAGLSRDEARNLLLSISRRRRGSKPEGSPGGYSRRPREPRMTRRRGCSPRPSRDARPTMSWRTASRWSSFPARR